MFLGAGMCLSARAANIYWDNAGGTATNNFWSSAASWNVASDGSGSDPSAAPGAADTAYFNVTSLNTTNTGAQYIWLDAGFSAAGLVFSSSNATTIRNNNLGTKTNFIGAGGVTINAGAGKVTMHQNTSTNRLHYILTADQTWLNNSGSTLGFAPNCKIFNQGYTLTFDGTGTISFEANNAGTGNMSGAGGIIKNGAGLLNLTGSFNSFTGGVTINGGTMDVDSLKSGTNSSIGASSSDAGNLVIAGTLKHSGNVLGTTDRLFTIGNASSNAATLDSSATTNINVLSFTNPGELAFGSTNAHTFTLTGSNTGTNLLACALGDNVGLTTLVKANTGSWILSGANSYSGGTTISAGTLVGAADGAFGASNITVVGGATLVLTNGVNFIADSASLFLSASSILSLNFTGADTINAISLDGGATWLPNGTYTAAQLVTAGLAGATGTGSFTVSGTPPPPPPSQDIYWDAGGATNLWWTNSVNWNTAADGSGTDPSVDLTSLPGSTAYFNISSLNQNLSVTMGTNISIGGLVFNNTGTTTITNDGMGIVNVARSITLGAAGITINSGAGAVTLGLQNNITNRINTSLAANQTWVNNSTNLFKKFSQIQLNSSILTVDGTGNMTFDPIGSGIKGTAGSSAGIIKNGTGTLSLNGTNSYPGATVINSGILNVVDLLGNGGAQSSIGQSSSAASNLVFGGGTLQYSGTKFGIALTDRLFTIGNAHGDTAALDASGASATTNVVIFANIGAIAYGNTHAHTLTLTGSNTGTNTFACALGDNVGLTSLAKAGVGTWIISGSNSYGGGTTVSGGTLVGAADGVFGTSNVTVTGGASLVLTGGTNFLGDRVRLTLDASSVLSLNFTGADTVGGVSLDGGTTWLPNGIYTATDLVNNGLAGATGGGSLDVIGVAAFFTLTAGAGANGTVTPTSTNVVSGSNADFTVTAAQNYRISSLTTNGTDVTGMTFDNGSTTTNFIWSNVQAAGTLAATFTVRLANDPAGTPYTWLASYGLTNFDADANADQDHDGLKTWQEYIAGTDPTSAASCLKVAQTNRNTVTWSPVAGRLYSVYWSTNLVKGFTNLATSITYPQGSYTNTTPDAKVNHYQVKVQLQ